MYPSLTLNNRGHRQVLHLHFVEGVDAYDTSLQINNLDTISFSGSPPFLSCDWWYLSFSSFIFEEGTQDCVLDGSM
jgi:hypothetical protein